MAAVGNQLPRELWETILDAVFDDLLLFETDPLRHFLTDRRILSKWHTENSEDAFYRQRATLRLVCHSWRDYVDSDGVKYRYTRLWDIHIYDEATIVQLSRARRIAGPHYPTIIERNRRKPHLKDHGYQISLDQRIMVELGLTLQSRLLGARILSTCTARLSHLVIKESPESFANLETLHLDLGFLFWPGPPLEMLDKITKNFRRLVFLWLELGTRFTFMSSDVLELPHLRTLIITAGSLSGIPYEKWRLPNLRHLDLSRFGDAREVARFWKGVSAFGKQLEVVIVRVGHRPENLEGLSDILTDCPNIKYLGAPLVNIVPWCPPSNHPLTTLVNTDDETLAFLDVGVGSGTDAIDMLIEFCTILANVTTIRESHDWEAPEFDRFRGERSKEVVEGSLVTYQDARLFQAADGLVKLAQRMKELSIRFEDKHGRLFGEQ
ncbi:hypothetical protein PIIN_00946 [Serendipita indica DSM 11827]|uniref:Uncharacterized protein n=1 Tax=Serendipita indica (strain DSM 11827) TaxID=1109443 RepID=G4T6Z1_SERID|nr:hypothetical protein PIIN_00946 [Serendipita indica DSM 11827]